MRLTQKQKDEFIEDGFINVRNVFSAEEVQRLRDSLTAIFAKESHYAGDINGTPKNKFSLRLNFCTRYPELTWILVHPGMNAALRSLLGDDFVFLPEMAAHASGYGSWHKDTTAQESSGHMFQWEKDYLMVEATIYLQDNDKSGGGLAVIPGSHRKPDGRLKPSIPVRIFNRLRRYLRPLPFVSKIVDPGSYNVPSKMGDLVIFDFRLDHTATKPLITHPPKKEKLALFFACSVNNEYARRYCDFINQRPDYLYLKDTPLYSEDVLAAARDNNVRLMV